MKKIILLLNMIIIILLGVSCGNNDENRYLKDQFLTGFKEHHGSDYKTYDLWYNLTTTDVISNLDKTRTKVVSRNIYASFDKPYSYSACTNTYYFYETEELCENGLYTRKRSVEAKSNENRYYRKDTTLNLLTKEETSKTYGLEKSSGGCIDDWFYTTILHPEYYDIYVEEGIIASWDVRMYRQGRIVTVIINKNKQTKEKYERYEFYYNYDYIIEKFRYSSTYGDYTDKKLTCDRYFYAELINPIDIIIDEEYEYNKSPSNLFFFKQDDFVDLYT